MRIEETFLWPKAVTMVWLIGPTPMKTSTARRTSFWHTTGRDMQHDWDGWSIWERRAVTVVTCASSAAALFWLAMSVSLLG
jgi:hypothetical protein